MSILHRSLPYNQKVNDWLVYYGKNVTSQNGEDGIIDYIFQKVYSDETKTVAPRRWCVEFGAWDGKYKSNTYNLLYNQPTQWKGILIEAQEDRYDQLKKTYASHPNVTCVHSLVELQGETSLDALLARHNAELPIDFDLISIDIDGADYHIWDSLSVYRPKLVLIEFNPTIPNNVLFIQEKNVAVYHGSSIAALVALGKQKQYELVSSTTFNAFFIRAEDYPLFHIRDNCLDKMHQTTMPTEFFQLYDGTICLTGCKKLLWKGEKGRKIEHEEIQILKKEERTYQYAPIQRKGKKESEQKEQKEQKEKELSNEERDIISAYNQRERERHTETTETNNTEITILSLIKTILNGKDKQKDNKALQVLEKIQNTLLDSPQNDSQNFMRQLLTFLHDYVLQLGQKNRNDRMVQWMKYIIKSLVLPSGEQLKRSEKAQWIALYGDALGREKQYKKALQWLDIALGMETNCCIAWKVKARIYTKMGENEKKDRMIQQLQRFQQLQQVQGSEDELERR